MVGLVGNWAGCDGDQGERVWRFKYREFACL